MLETLEFSSHMHTFTALWDCWVQAVDGIILVYSINSRSSFTNLRAFYHKIINIIIKSGRDVDDFVLFLVGTKCEETTTREVSMAEGLALAQDFCCEFIETSAKNDWHVGEPFFGVVRALRSRRMPRIMTTGNAKKRGSKAIYRGFFQFIRQAFRRQSFTRQKLQAYVQSPGIEASLVLNRKSGKPSRNNNGQAMKKRLQRRVSSDEQSAFYAAAATGHSKEVKLLLAKGANVSAKGAGYMRPLQVAALEGHSNVARLLLENGAPVDEKTRMHGTALICASSRAQIGVARVLLDRRADVNEKGGRFGNALQAAAALGKVDVARLLLDSGANVDAIGDGGFTALQVAAFPGRVDMIELLLSRGALPDLQLTAPSPVTHLFSFQVEHGVDLPDVVSHFDYGASDVVRESAQMIVDLVHKRMYGAAKQTEAQGASN